MNEHEKVFELVKMVKTDLNNVASLTSDVHIWYGFLGLCGVLMLFTFYRIYKQIKNINEERKLTEELERLSQEFYNQVKTNISSLEEEEEKLPPIPKDVKIGDVLYDCRTDSRLKVENVRFNRGHGKWYCDGKRMDKNGEFTIERTGLSPIGCDIVGHISQTPENHMSISEHKYVKIIQIS